MERKRTGRSRTSPTICLVGVGNIGSQAIGQLAHLVGVRRVLIVDRDRYEPSNLASQAITERDLGRPKALVQARRLRQLQPALEVEAYVGDLETLPLGWLRGSVVVGCLDSMHARLRLGEMAWRVGAWFLDGGVHPEAGLARVSGYRPGPHQPCFACALDDRDYAALGTRGPCVCGTADAPTNGSFSLGGLASALLAIECEKLLAGRRNDALAGREVLADAQHRGWLVSERRRNPACRFDHQVWSVTTADGVSLDDSLDGALRQIGKLVVARGAKSRSS